jgi:osmotically-inducible protein OsmY
VAARHDPSGSLAAAALGVAALVASPAALAQTSLAAPARSEVRAEIVITATREADALLAAKVERALEKDPYLFTEHVSVSAENGLVRLTGFAEDPFEILQMLRLARRTAGKQRVVNEIELIQGTWDHD